MTARAAPAGRQIKTQAAALCGECGRNAEWSDRGGEKGGGIEERQGGVTATGSTTPHHPPPPLMLLLSLHPPSTSPFRGSDTCPSHLTGKLCSFLNPGPTCHWLRDCEQRAAGWVQPPVWGMDKKKKKKIRKVRRERGREGERKE